MTVETTDWWSQCDVPQTYTSSNHTKIVGYTCWFSAPSWSRIHRVQPHGRSHCDSKISAARISIGNWNECGYSQSQTVNVLPVYGKQGMSSLSDSVQ
jgi:hypothetical protein